MRTEQYIGQFLNKLNEAYPDWIITMEWYPETTRIMSSDMKACTLRSADYYLALISKEMRDKVHDSSVLDYTEKEQVYAVLSQAHQDVLTEWRKCHLQSSRNSLQPGPQIEGHIYHANVI